jgi:hypothetical protein
MSGILFQLMKHGTNTFTSCIYYFVQCSMCWTVFAKSVINTFALSLSLSPSLSVALSLFVSLDLSVCVCVCEGLCRTCEIFGASALVLDSLRHVSDKHFQALSVSSELWLPLLEVGNNT